MAGGKEVARRPLAYFLRKKSYFCPMNTATKVKIKAQSLDLDEVLAGVAQLNTSDLEQFMQQVGSIVAHRKAPSISAREEELMAQIMLNMPQSWVRRYNKLHRKMQSQQLNEDEYSELEKMIALLEKKNAERLQAMIELSQIRGLTLHALMSQLGIRWPQNGR